MRLTYPGTNKKGFTLIELTIVIVLFIILSIALFWTFVAGLKIWNSGKNRSDIRQGGNWAIERMVRELSQAYSIRNADGDEITFWADSDGDDEVTFNVDDNELIRTAGSAETILTPYVDTLTLSYRDINNNLMTLPQDTASQSKRDNIRVIIMSLTLNAGDDTVTLSSSIYTRNQGL